MPVVNYTPLEVKLHALSLIDLGKSSIRATALAVGIAKSTLFDNLPKFRESIKEYSNWHETSEQRLIRNTLAIAMEGKSSARDTAAVLSRIEGHHIDHHKVLNILETAAEISAIENLKKIPLRIVKDGEETKPPLSNVSCAAFDEIFQGQKPILTFLEPVSGYCHLVAAEDRKADTWKEMLEELKMLGLNPETTITDGGQGLLKALGEVFPNSINLRDLFHVLNKLGRALNAFEGFCYRLIAKLDKLAARDADDDKTMSIKDQMDKAITLFDALEKEVRLLKTACYFENSKDYICSNELEIIVKRVIAIIECVERQSIYHRSIKEAKTYLKGAREEIVAYKLIIEKQVKEIYGETVALSVLASICPMIEFLDQIQRSYENKKRRKYWEKKLVEARKAFRDVSYVDQDEVDEAINQVAQIMLRIRKSNSLVENLNSIVRRFLVSYKSIPSWFCPLFTFSRNHRTHTRGKRIGLKPKEILTGKLFEQDWIDIIIEKWPSKNQKAQVEKSKQIALAG